MMMAASGGSEEVATKSDNFKGLQHREGSKNNLVVYGIPESKNNTSDGKKLYHPNRSSNDKQPLHRI